MSVWLAGATVVGKVPWDHEFLRGAGDQTVRAFEEWLYSGASTEAHAWAASPKVHAFAMPLQAACHPEALSVGVLAPSADAAGRSYATAVVATLSASAAAAHPEILPILLEPFWGRAVEVLARVRQAPLAPDDDAPASLTRDALDPADEALRLYAGWVGATSRATACAQLARPPGWLDGAVDRAAAALRPGRSGPAGRSVRIPLGESAGASLCMWLDVAWRAAGRAGAIPAFFWSHDGQSGEALVGHCLAPATVLNVLLGGASSGSVLDLVRTPESPGEELDGPRDASLAGLLGGDGGPIADLLEIVG
ncbi:MAG: TagF domain-containing protein [Polyangiaceae bacterium]